MKDIESLLAKDKRYLQLEGMADERHRLLLEYLDDLERKGPPPPPTASEPSRRLKTAWMQFYSLIWRGQWVMHRNPHSSVNGFCYEAENIKKTLLLL